MHHALIVRGDLFDPHKEIIPMSSPTSLQSTLPMSLDEVTSEWLTQAMSVTFPDITVIGHSFDAKRAGTSTSARVQLTYGETAGHKNLPSAVYIKGGFDPVMRRRVWEALIQEARFYAELGPVTPVKLPAYYFAGVDRQAKQGVLLLEDMTDRGVTFGHATKEMSVELVADILEQQARYHAHWWESPALQNYQDWSRPQRVYLEYLFRPKNWEAIHERDYGYLIQEVLPNRETGLKGLHKLWELNDSLPKTLVHGDQHGGNLYFEADGSPGFLDWQCVYAGNHVHDVMWMMVTGLDTESRRSHEADLLQHYRKALLAHGAPAPSYNDLFLSYRQNIMHGLSSGVANPFDMQTEEVTNITSTRILHAAMDLDTIEALSL